ncbi:MAG: hypothetical protein E6625_20480 [Enterobacter asburiae]|jgi:hypothetical protein|uniref:hypothetical protein n=1 Tax=Enterobacter asburiae TaxID=61645 RepID=UPI002910F1C0|nr:hypothetical protein [Enterobacter asburiae]
MKVLQTLGSYNYNGQVGIFQYRRIVAGVEINPLDHNLHSVVIPHNSWTNMLTFLDGLQKKVNGLSDLKKALSQALRGVQGIHNNHMPAVAAILEHEGSIDHYGGKMGRNQSATIYLKTEI